MATIRDVGSNQGDTVLTFPKTYKVFGITNDGDDTIIFNIGGIEIEVRATESWESGFNPFDTVIITTPSTVAYRWYVGF